MNRSEHTQRLINRALQVSKGSADQFSVDDKGLSVLLEEVDSAEYIVTRRSKRVMEEMLNGICEDGQIYKGFEQKIHPLYDRSPPLQYISKLAYNLADRTKEGSLDLARALLIDLPGHIRKPSLQTRDNQEASRSLEKS